MTQPPAPPVFSTWDEFVAYLDATLKRLRTVEASIPQLRADARNSRDALQAAQDQVEQDRSLLQQALQQGKNLAP